MAIRRQRPAPGLICHTDRGVQYACEPYRKALAAAGITPSMSRKGNCLDNAPHGELLALAQEPAPAKAGVERVHHRIHATRAEARRDPGPGPGQALFARIEGRSQHPPPALRAGASFTNRHGAHGSLTASNHPGQHHGIGTTATATLADGHARRPSPRGRGLQPADRRTVRAEHRTRVAMGHLTQGRPGLAGLRHPGRALCRSWDRLHQHACRPSGRGRSARLVHSAVARPQSRGKIERFFGTLNTELLAAMPGRLVGGKPASPPRLTLSELDAAIGAFTSGRYNARPHPAVGMSPNAAWTADGWLPWSPARLEELDELLAMVASPRVAARDGIRFGGLRYLDPTIAAFVGERVTIRHDPRDVAEIWVFHRGRFLYRAVNAEHADRTVSLRDVQAARLAVRGAVLAQPGVCLTTAPASDPPGRGSSRPCSSATRASQGRRADHRPAAPRARGCRREAHLPGAGPRRALGPARAAPHAGRAAPCRRRGGLEARRALAFAQGPAAHPRARRSRRRRLPLAHRGDRGHHPRGPHDDAYDRLLRPGSSAP